MDKVKELLKRLGVELTAEQVKQLEEVIGKEFVPADSAGSDKAKLEELTKQLAERDKDLEKLKSENKSEELSKQLDELKAKYAADTKALSEKLTARETDFAAEKLFSGYSFASDRVKKSVLDEFKAKGFKFENGEFVGGKEYLEGLKKSEPDVFAAEKPGLFMAGTAGNADTGADNQASLISSAFGLKSKIGG